MLRKNFTRFQLNLAPEEQHGPESLEHFDDAVASALGVPVTEAGTPLVCVKLQQQQQQQQQQQRAHQQLSSQSRNLDDTCLESPNHDVKMLEAYAAIESGNGFPGSSTFHSLGPPLQAIIVTRLYLLVVSHTHIFELPLASLHRPPCLVASARDQKEQKRLKKQETASHGVKDNAINESDDENGNKWSVLKSVSLFVTSNVRRLSSSGQIQSSPSSASESKSISTTPTVSPSLNSHSTTIPSAAKTPVLIKPHARSIRFDFRPVPNGGLAPGTASLTLRLAIPEKIHAIHTAVISLMHSSVPPRKYSVQPHYQPRLPAQMHFQAPQQLPQPHDEVYIPPPPPYDCQNGSNSNKNS
jgi:hypothetical protein